MERPDEYFFGIPQCSSFRLLETGFLFRYSGERLSELRGGEGGVQFRFPVWLLPRRVPVPSYFLSFKLLS
jgi:hypothetical protein